MKALRNSASAFRTDRRGNVAVMFALATLPIIGMVGTSIDYSRANTLKTKFQDALDSTALMLAKEASTDTSSQLQTNATKYFNALFNQSGVNNISITASYSASTGSNVLVKGTAGVPTNFMKVLGYNNITIGGSSTASWGSNRLRVALVLDNTGSMAQSGKMTALKTATHNLLSQLKSAASVNGDVYVSIVPFSKDVNVGASNYGANWIDWHDWDSSNGSWQYTTTCTESARVVGQGEVENENSSKRGRNRCSGSWTWVAANHNTWNGCITDRDQDYDQNVTAPNPADANLPQGQASTLFPAEQYGWCPLQMMGLSYDWTSMNSLVDQMYPNGNTNQPIGLVWGWQSLVGGGPLTAPAKDPNYKYSEIIILLSDGLNTEDRWYQAQTPVDNRMVQTGNGSGTCANIKAAGITIYTIQVNTGGDPTSTLLKNCASGTDKFFMLTSASQIVSTFQSIGTNLTQLRIAK